jgi:hypothetical protein
MKYALLNTPTKVGFFCRLCLFLPSPVLLDKVWLRIGRPSVQFFSVQQLSRKGTLVNNSGKDKYNMKKGMTQNNLIKYNQ